MIKWLTFVFVFTAISLSAQTVEVEAIFDENGDWVVSKTASQRKLAWLQMFANGRFQEFPELSGIEIDAVFSNRWNGRITKDSLSVIMADFQNSSMFPQLPNDEIEDVLFFERWPWGTDERKVFSTLRFTDMTQSRLDSIRQDSVRWRIPPAVLRDSLNLNVTLRQVNNNVQIPQRIKTWFQNNVLGRAGITLDTTLWELITTHRKKAKQLWLRHPFIANKLKARWLKRRSQ